uniref:Uncharacterized protein n=1 Tax=Anguilla anguilla TaxID=7936 RepID=A0A0E9S8Y1_ANGAN
MTVQAYITVGIGTGNIHMANSMHRYNRDQLSLNLLKRLQSLSTKTLFQTSSSLASYQRCTSTTLIHIPQEQIKLYPKLTDQTNTTQITLSFPSLQ